MPSGLIKFKNIIGSPRLFGNLLHGWLIYLFYIIKRFSKLKQFRNPQLVFVSFDYSSGIYADFYINLYNELSERKPEGLVILLSFNTKKPNWNFDSRFKKKDFVPEFYLRYIVNNIFVTATELEPHKRIDRHQYVQVFHGFASLGSGFGENYIKGFDKIFLTTPYQYFQLTEGSFRQLTNKENLAKVGYSKIDGAINLAGAEKSDPIGAIFYGPTYHREISSIFEFLDPLINYTCKRNIKLFIKLHPLLLLKYDHDKSGGIDWEERIIGISKDYPNVQLVPTHLAFEKVNEYFYKSAYFITDTSGLGYEYALITGRPVVFLGSNLKIPIEDLRSKKYSPYSKLPEIKYRGIIGPIIEEQQQLEEMLDNFKKEIRSYEKKNIEFRNNFTYNLGKASTVAVLEIIKLFDRYHSRSER